MSSSSSSSLMFWLLWLLLFSFSCRNIFSERRRVARTKRIPLFTTAAYFTRVSAASPGDSIKRFEALYDGAHNLRDLWKEKGVLYHNANVYCPGRGAIPLTISRGKTESPFVQVRRFCETCTSSESISICVEKIIGTLEASGIVVHREPTVSDEDDTVANERWRVARNGEESDVDDVRRFQRYIRDRQEIPRKDCKTVRVTMMENILSGLGSQVHIMANTFLVSLLRERLFVSELWATQYVDARICPRRNFDCVLESITSCKLSDIVDEADAEKLRAASLAHDEGTKVIVLGKYTPRVSFDFHECHGLTPEMLEDLRKHAGLARRHDETWYFRQVMRYIWRPNRRVRAFANAFSRHVGFDNESLSVVGVHMRWNKNTWNGKGFSEGGSYERPFDFSTDEWALTAKHFAADRVARTIFLSSNAPARYQDDFVAAVAPLRVIRAPLEMWSDVSLKDTHETGSLAFASDSASRLRVCKEDGTCDSDTHAYDEAMLLIATIELFAKCRILIGCYSSNVARLVYEVMAIRMESACARCMEAGARPPTYDMDGSAYYTCGEYEDKFSIGKKRRVFRDLFEESAVADERGL